MTICDMRAASAAWGGFPFNFHLALYGAMDALSQTQPLHSHLPSDHLFEQSSAPQTLGTAGNPRVAHSLGKSAATMQKDGTNGMGVLQAHTYEPRKRCVACAEDHSAP